MHSSRRYMDAAFRVTGEGGSDGSSGSDGSCSAATRVFNHTNIVTLSVVDGRDGYPRRDGKNALLAWLLEDLHRTREEVLFFDGVFVACRGTRLCTV